MITPFCLGFFFLHRQLFEHSLHKIQSNYIYLLPYAYQKQKQQKNNNNKYNGKKEISKWFEKQEWSENKQSYKSTQTTQMRNKKNCSICRKFAYFFSFCFWGKQTSKALCWGLWSELKSIRLLQKIAKKNINKQMDVEIKYW